MFAYIIRMKFGKNDANAGESECMNLVSPEQDSTFIGPLSRLSCLPDGIVLHTEFVAVF